MRENHNLNLQVIEKELKDQAKLVKEKGASKFTVKSNIHKINLNSISPNAIRVVTSLTKAGYKAYLVGGCVRDLILGKNPKDFDVCTSATPQQVTKVLKNSRIIGRRFKIVHVNFGRDIIEVSTFRSAKRASGNERRSSDDGMLVADNAYGTSEIEDSQRRDFTINALYYDVGSQTVLDFNAGLYDLLKHQIELIGDPDTRYKEDPVRMIRACRFAAKLDFDISPRTLNPIDEHLPLLSNISNARMYEEINKLFLTGHGEKSFERALDMNLIDHLFPMLNGLIRNQVYISFVKNALANSDVRARQDKPNRTHFLYSVLLWGAFYQKILHTYKELQLLENQEERKKIFGMAHAIIKKENTIALIPELVEQDITNLWFDNLLMIELASHEDLIESFYKKKNFRACYDFMILRCKIEPLLSYCVKVYEPYYERSLELKREMEEDRAQHKGKKKKNKKTRLKRKLNAEIDRYLAMDFEDSKLRHNKNEVLAKTRAWRRDVGLD